MQVCTSQVNDRRVDENGARQRFTSRILPPYRTGTCRRATTVYVWVDGIHFNIRLEDDRLCTLALHEIMYAPTRATPRRGSTPSWRSSRRSTRGGRPQLLTIPRWVGSKYPRTDEWLRGGISSST